MSPRPKFGEGFFNPLETGIESMGTWLPVTPAKPIPARSNAVLVDKYGNRLGHENLHELAACYGELETRNYDGAVHNPRLTSQEVRSERHYGGDGHGTVERTRVINHIARQVNRSGGVGCSSSLFEHLWAVKNAAANSTQSRSTTMVSLVSNSHSQVDNWRDFESANLLLQEQAHCLGSNTLSNGDSFHHISQDPVSDNSQLSLEANMSRERWSRPERDRDKDLLESQLVENVVQLPPGDKSNLDSRGHQVIDLNETPQQKPPKRRKHRPKVVVENKPKRTPKPMPSPKNAETKENITGKRKYVRKKPLKEKGTPSQPSQTTTSGGPVVKSCKRALNFDSERTRNESQYETLIGQQQECCQRSKMTFNLNLDAQATELDGTSSGGFPKSTTVIGQQNGLSLENQQLKRMSNNSTPVIGQQNILQMENQHWERMANMSTPMIDQQNGLLMENKQWRVNTRPTPLMNHIPPNYVSFPERKVVASSIPQRNGIQAPNFETMLRNVDVRTANPLQLSGQHQHNSTQAMMHAKGVAQTVLQGRMGSVNNERIRQVIPPSTPHLAPTNNFLLQEGRGNKRNYYNAMEQTHPHAAKLTGSSSADILRMREHQRNSSIHNGSSLDANKKKRLDSGYNLNVNGMPCGIETLHGGPTPVQTTYANNVSGNLLTPQRNCDILDSLIGSNNISRNENTAANSCLSGQYAQSMASSHYLPRQHTIPEQLTFKENLGEINRLNPVHNIASLTTNENLVPPTPQNKAPAHRNKRGPKPRSANVSVKEGAGTTVAKSVLSRGRPAKQSNPNPMDELVEKFERVYISAKVENAIVPYNGDRSVVPYDGDKRRKPRPKVDLDPETNRIWKLLMANEGSECFEEADKEKQKWWEEERGVFKLRAESFIAKMHLVQGDRRFSKWKGSVVDSVIGVFLTQNVSDHLSSSAFMCLAAKFPPKRTCSLSGTKISTDEPEVCVLNPNENTQGHELVLRQPIWGQSPRTLNRSVDHQKGDENSEIEQTSSVEAFSPSLEDGVLSSQGSFTSPNLQGSGGIRSSSGSNSEAEDPVCGWKPGHDLGLTNFLHMENFNLSQESHDFLNQSLLFQDESGYGHNGLDNTNKGKQKLMPGNITDDDGNLSFTALLNSPYILESQPSSRNCMYAGLCLNSSPLIGPLAEDVGETIPQIATNSICGEIPTPTPHALFSQQPMQQQNIPWHANHVEAPANVQSAQETPKAAAKAFDIQEGIYGATEQPRAKSNLGKSDSTEREASTPKANTPKANKGKAERENKNAFDWDSLRKEVQRKKTQRERSEDTMDSLDYEAMRRARVEDISGTIRARGMNNMLAERIKDFLDRLVNEHGSIDLEWLRDVPPEKAKDYLLSIRGLGLKSVECVRLLTLHHLAFPVDTNVGRIAVRLGWVPLQPLPESLQIHLLELYPLLETIQKYLWPRLCTLDQPTLYELHYQLITFGKVFCTKSKPNCNACPMRGECRHFASAFASARLALPGPEERGIVRSTAPIAPERHHASVNNPMLPLPPPAENSLRVSVEGSGIRNCEPIIEEPPSPEPEAQHTELTQADIEDLFWEEPDDGIPEIKISPEQLASTVQDVIQEDGRLREADLSRALVAIDPTDPFIPIPQLKLLSRLRTEHLVYELPDTHPLLEGMDIRERDDPSPYLLAIWASGEKFDLNPPPQKECKIHELGQICNVETCAPCNGAREADLGIVRGTILIPCRTAMQGSFPLNGTYFQVNEVFADHDTSIKPVNVPRDLIWNLPRRVVHFGTSVTAVFRGLPTDKIQQSFWRGFICVRAFQRSTGAPRPLVRRLHQIPSQKKRE